MPRPYRLHIAETTTPPQIPRKTPMINDLRCYAWYVDTFSPW